MFYNLIMYKESTMFLNAFEKHYRCHLMLVKFRIFDVGVFFRFSLNIWKKKRGL